MNASKTFRGLNYFQLKCIGPSVPVFGALYICQKKSFVYEIIIVKQALQNLLANDCIHLLLHNIRILQDQS